MAVNIVPGDFFVAIPEAIRVHKRHLRVIMKALKDRDGESAERELISMLRQDAGLVIALLTERGVIGQDAIGGAGAGPAALPHRPGPPQVRSGIRLSRRLVQMTLNGCM